jgi:predicted Zn-dependent peptidase
MSVVERWVVACAAAFAVIGAVPVGAQRAPVAGEVAFEMYTLPNGLEVVLAPDRSVPVVAVDVWYHVGAANEREGRTGFAHLFEHMMFQGSANVAKGEHMQLVERAGGNMNGTTGSDRTNYFQTLPAHQLPLGLWLEADRMRSLAVTQENLDNQREVVKEERRMRVDNAPYGVSIRSAISTVPYSAEGCFAYGHEGIGSMEDLDAARLEDVQNFFRTYYAPNNATLTIVGDFDDAEARRLVERHFGSIPAGPAIPQVECPDPFSHLPVRKTFEDTNANLPAIFLTFGLPSAREPDVPALRLLAAILADGESSRLNQKLVREEQAAVQVLNFADFRRGPGVLVVGAISNQGVEAARLEELLEEEFSRVRETGVTAEELEKVKNQYRSRSIRALQTALGTAEALQEANFLYGEPSALRSEMERTLAVTLEDVQRVARQYLNPQNRSVVVTEPTTAAEE